MKVLVGNVLREALMRYIVCGLLLCEKNTEWMAEYKYPAKIRAFNKHIDYDIMVLDWNNKIYWENGDLMSSEILFGGSSKWWHRKILNSHLPMDTANLQLYMEQFPLKNNWKLAEQLIHIGKWGKSHMKMVAEAETQSFHNPYPITVTCIRKGTPKRGASH